MRSSLVRSLSVAGLLVAGAAAQATTIVSGGGGALNAAVQQASPGDRLIVRAALYDMLFVDRGLIIECDPGVQFDAGNTAGGPPLRIAGVPAGQSLIVRGGGIVGYVPRIEIVRCAGIVAWIGCHGSVGELVIERCTSVSIDASRLPYIWHIATTLSAVAISNVVSCSSIRIAGGALALDDVNVQPRGGEVSLRAVSAAVTVSGGTFPGSATGFHGQLGLPGISLQAAELTITAGAQVTAGYGWQSSALHAIEGDYNSLVRLDPSVQLVAPGPPIQGTATVRQGTIAFLDVPGVLRSGMPFDVVTHGAPQDAVFVFVDVPGPVTATGFGPLWVRPTSPLFDLVMIPAGSTSVRSQYVMPPLPAAVPVVLQPIRLGRTAEIGLGTPSRVSIN